MKTTRRLSRWVLVSVMLFGMSLIATRASAGEWGTRDEATAMLNKVIADMKKDKTGTMAKITAKAYNDRDLYPFCSSYSDGKISAHGGDKSRIGMTQADLKDATGKPYGAEIQKVAKEDRISEVSYMFRRPGSDGMVPKVSLIMKVHDQACGVGYYVEKK